MWRSTSLLIPVLACLLEPGAKLVTHRQALESVWGGGYNTHVYLLRMTICNQGHQLESVTPGDSHMSTEYGVGYRLVGSSTPVELASGLEPAG